MFIKKELVDNRRGIEEMEEVISATALKEVVKLLIDERLYDMKEIHSSTYFISK